MASETVGHAASDIREDTWVDRLVPAPIRPYLRLMRLDRPIGTWLLLFPCWWSLALATQGVPDLRLAILFAIGSLIMRGAGCTINDIADRDFDAQVARTALRPIASGAISVRQAFAFLGVQLFAGLMVLVQMNWFTVALGTSSLMLVALYPFAKRVTYWPQAVLGLTFNWGALMGWAAVHGEISPAALALYVACFFWTLGYDTIYAHQDKEDDALVGIKSTALRLGDATRPWLFFFYGAAILWLGVAGWLADLLWPYFVGVALAGTHMTWQAIRADFGNPRHCLKVFKSNRLIGWTVLAGTIAAQVLAVPPP